MSFDEAKAKAFLNDLSELSLKYGVAISENGVLYMMEREDYDFHYQMDDESKITRA